MKDPFDVKLDPEEQEIEDSFEDFVSVSNPDEYKQSMKKAAVQTMKKNKVINLRVPEETVTRYKIYAVQKNIPYQTLMASTLHEFSMKHLSSL